MALLSATSIHDIHGAAVALGLDRRTLLQGLDRAFVASLPRAPDDASQLFTDLVEMNRAERLVDGSVPLHVWLRTAASLARSRRESKVFLRAIEELARWDPTLERVAPSRPTPRYRDEASRKLSEAIEAEISRKQERKARGESTGEIQKTINTLRRRMREGGQLVAGDSLGDDRYLLIEKIGQGGFAVVWKALDRRSGALVAVKVLHGTSAEDASRKERFFRGAREMAKLSHDAVVRVIETASQDLDHFYFVMELVEGRDLRRAVLDEGLDQDAAIAVILRVGDALAHAHARGVIHRDVKPSNILLDARGAARLTDFDLVVAEDTTGGTNTNALGTFIYAAPEQLNRPQEVDARADVYSLGMTALFCFHGADLTVQAVRDAGKVIDRLSCGDAQKAVLRRAVAWERTERFASVAAFCAALEAAVAPRAPSSARRKWLIVTGIVLSSAAAAYATGYLDPVLKWLRGLHEEPPVLVKPTLDPVATGAIATSVVTIPSIESSTSATVLVSASPPPTSSPSILAPPPSLACPEGMKLVPAGSFDMGAAPGMGHGDDYPLHTVTLPRYCIDTREVTVADYIKHRQSVRLGPWDLRDVQLCNWNSPGNSHVTHPLNCVTWREANAYCTWALKRLPSEEEWEYAARYADQRVYPWGNNDPTSRLKLANFCDVQCKTLYDRLSNGQSSRKPMKDELSDGWETTAPVGEFPDGASQLGLLDMAGNVSEWTGSAYCEGYSKEACSGKERVYRGGSWDSGNASLLTTTRRYHAGEKTRNPFIGFRCAADLK